MFVETFDGDEPWFYTLIDNHGGVNQVTLEAVTEPGRDNACIVAPLHVQPDRLMSVEAQRSDIFGDLVGLALTVDTKISGAATDPGDLPTVRFYLGATDQGGG